MDQHNLEESLPSCSECSELPGIIRRLKKHFCPECWIYRCNFRFRKRLYELGKTVKGSIRPPRDSSGITCIFGPPEPVLIYYDCSPWAKSLLSLVKDTILANLDVLPATEHQKNPPFPFVFKILFIHDELGKFNHSNSLTSRGNGIGTENDLKELRNWLSESKSVFDIDFPLLVTSLETSLSSINETRWKEIQRTDVSVDLPFDVDLNSQLIMLVDNLKSTSSRIDFLDCLRQNLIISIAKHLKLSKVFLPDQQTTMSIKMFSMMSLGRGIQLSEQMSLISKLDEVELVRPMMDLSSDDLLDYLSSLDKTRTTTRVLENKERRIDDITSQCEDFILTLQKDYPSTVPTLTKIGGKLDSNGGPGSTSSEILKCRLCKQRQEQDGIETIDFCYGCSNILKEMKDVSILLGLLEP